jgi:hypothetical protein
MTHNNRVLQLVCILAAKSSALALGLNGFALRIPIGAFRRGAVLSNRLPNGKRLSPSRTHARYGATSL